MVNMIKNEMMKRIGINRTKNILIHMMIARKEIYNAFHEEEATTSNEDT